MQFWYEIIFVISNQTRATRSLDLEIKRMISDQIALHPVQLPLYTVNSLLTDTSIKRTTCVGPCALFCQSFYYNLTLYKMDTSLRRTVVNGPDGVRLRELTV